MPTESNVEDNDDEDKLNAPIHVLEVAGNAIIGGMEKYVYNIAQHLPSHNYKVTVITPFQSAFTASLRHLGCEVFTTLMDNDPPWRSIQFVTELVRQLKVDILHAHIPRGHVLAGIVGKLTGIPVVATVHGMDVTSHELGICRTTGTNLTVVCQEAYSQALSLGLPSDRLTLIPNGVDLKTFTPTRTGASFRRAVHIPADAPLVGLVGRLAWEKGADQFIEMAARIHAVRPDFHFALVGEGPMERDLTELIRRNKLEDVVHLAGTWTNTWEVYPAFDILAQTSRVEGMPFAILEGMACGKPVAAMGVGGVGEIVEVGTTGMLSAPGDYSGLGEGILKLFADPERMRAMGQASRKRIEERFDLQDSIHLIDLLFRRLLGREDHTVHDSRTNEAGWPIVKRDNETVAFDPTLFQKHK